LINGRHAITPLLDFKHGHLDFKHRRRHDLHMIVSAHDRKCPLLAGPNRRLVADVP